VSLLKTKTRVIAMITNTFIIILLALVGCLVIGTWATCSSFENDLRPSLGNHSIPQCPYYTTNPVQQYNYTDVYWNGTANVVTNTTSISFNGSLGWCPSGFNYPYLAFFPSFSFATFGDKRHSFYVNWPVPWCVYVTAYLECLTPRASQWHPPSVIVNQRPLGPPNSTNGNCVNTFKGPPDPYGVPLNYPLWDEGGYYYRTQTLSINDGCTKPFPNFGVYGAVDYVIFAKNATLQPVAAGNTTGLLHWWGTMDNAAPVFTPIGQPAYSTCRSDCATFSNISCNGPHTRLPETFNVHVELACRDSGWGYLWRVVNAYGAPNLHMDWELVRAIENTTVKVSPHGFITPEVIIPFDAYFRMYPMTVNDDMFDIPLWPNATQKHGSQASTFFYIPNYNDLFSAAPNSSILFTERPTILKLYAGAPNHYIGTVAVAALVSNYDVDDLFQLTFLRTINVIDNATVLANTRFPADIHRQALLLLCSNASAIALAQSYLLPANLPYLCSLISNTSTLWSTLLNATFVNFFPNETLVDPVKPCTCAYVPCEPGNTNPTFQPRILFDYTAIIPPPQPNISVEPVCRMDNTSIGLYLNNLPPLPNLNGNPGDNVTTPLTIASPWINRLVAPFTIVGANVVYESSPLGVVWRINNNEPLTNVSGMSLRWEIGEFAPPSGTTSGEIITVPYTSGTVTSTTLGPSKSLWVFSRTTNPHKLYGNAQLGCVTPAECAAVVPQDPPPGSWGASHILYGQLDDPSTLPSCECYLNFPCNASVFLSVTNVNVNTSLLAPPLTPPVLPSPIVYVPIFSNCTPMPEICNGLDDNCNGTVDDVPGAFSNCTTFYTAGLCADSPGILMCNLTSGQLECMGQVLPTQELCDNFDRDCDGIPGNVPGLGQPCGSDIGACVKGILTCVLGNLTAQCVGEVAALPAEICGNGIDDDCNALVDDGCPPNPPPNTTGTPSSSAPTDSPSSPAIVIPPPTITTTEPTPPMLSAPEPPTLMSLWQMFLDMIGFSDVFGPFNIIVLVILLMILVFLAVICAILMCRQDMTKRYVYRSTYPSLLPVKRD
jgi:hypothetical protein